MYRLTGDRKWQDKGWRMFTAWIEHAITKTGLTDIDDVDETPSVQRDGMQSFVLAETLKYYYLLFSPFDLISLDDYVLNTEAHPFTRPKRGQVGQARVTPFWSGPEAGVEPAPSFGERMGEGTVVQKWFRVQQAHAMVNLGEIPPGPGRARVGGGWVKPSKADLDKARAGMEEKLRLLREKQAQEGRDAEQAEGESEGAGADADRVRVVEE